MAKKIKVLLGNNDAQNSCLFAEVMRKSGMDATVVEKDGKIIFEKILEIEPDVVIIEPFMKHKDAFGIMNAPEIKKLSPIFMIMTAYDNHETESHLMQNGAAYFFLLPLDMPMCCKVIEQFVMKKGDDEEKAKIAIQKHINAGLQKIGIECHLAGHKYLSNGILLYMLDTKGEMTLITKGLYPELSKKYNTSKETIERSIRYSIEQAYKANPDRFLKFFGNEYKGKKPTNNQFISMIAKKFLREIQSKSRNINE